MGSEFRASATDSRSAFMLLLLGFLRTPSLLDAEENDGQGLSDQPAEHHDGHVEQRPFREAKIRVCCCQQPRGLLQRVRGVLACILVEEDRELPALLGVEPKLVIAGCHTRRAFLLARETAPSEPGVE